MRSIFKTCFPLCKILYYVPRRVDIKWNESLFIYHFRGDIHLNWKMRKRRILKFVSIQFYVDWPNTCYIKKKIVFDCKKNEIKTLMGHLVYIKKISLEIRPKIGGKMWVLGMYMKWEPKSTFAYIINVKNL